MKTIKVKYAIIIVIMLLGAIYATQSVIKGKYQKQLDNASMALYESERAIDAYSIQVNGLKETVAQQDLIIISKDKDLFKSERERQRLKELNMKQVDVITRLEIRIQVLRDSIPPSDTVIIKKDCDGDQGSFIKLPLEYPFHDRWVTMNTSIDLEGMARQVFSIDSLPLSIIIGGQKESLFSKTRQVSTITTSNPYVEIGKMSTIKVEDKRKTPIHYLMVGTGVGVLGTIIAGLVL